MDLTIRCKIGWNFSKGSRKVSMVVIKKANTVFVATNCTDSLCFLSLKCPSSFSNEMHLRRKAKLKGGGGLKYKIIIQTRKLNPLILRMMCIIVFNDTNCSYPLDHHT